MGRKHLEVVEHCQGMWMLTVIIINIQIKILSILILERVMNVLMPVILKDNIDYFANYVRKC